MSACAVRSFAVLHYEKNLTKIFGAFLLTSFERKLVQRFYEEMVVVTNYYSDLEQQPEQKCGVLLLVQNIPCGTRKLVDIGKLDW